jgi:PPE-repeat protein
VVLSVLGVLGLVTLLFTAVGSSGSSNVAAPIAIETVSSADAAAVRPRPQVLASIGNLRVQLPVAAGALTAIGFHGSGDGSLSLQPVGRQANEGLLARLWRRIAGNGRQSPRWYQLEGGPAGTNVLDVGTAPGTDVYAPVKGSVIAVSDLVIGGKRVGSRIDLRPSEAPSVMVSVENVRPDPAIVVGTPVLAATSKLGTAVDIASVEKQALAAHAPEGGNNVSIAVYPSPGSLP